MALPTRILIVDDDPDHLLFCELVFKRRGYEVVSRPVLAGWEELLSILTDFEPHLIFLDHQMGAASGAELIKTLKSHSDHAHIPVVLFSAHEHIVALARQSGADGHLKKPFTIAKLLATTDFFLNR